MNHRAILVSLFSCAIAACGGSDESSSASTDSGGGSDTGGGSLDSARVDSPGADTNVADTNVAVDSSSDAGDAKDTADAPALPTFLLGVIDGSKLVRIDTSTGATTPVGTLTVGDIFALSFDPGSAKLYGARSNFSTILDLVTIDPCTATVTTIGPIKVATGTLNFVEGFAVDPAKGTLYITGSLTHVLPDSASEALLTVNPTTAQATFVANTDSPSGDIDSLLWIGDTMFATDVEGPASDETFLYKMSATTAKVTAVGTKATGTQIDQLAAHPKTGATFASDLKPSKHVSTANLTTNTYTPIADIAGLGAIAFVSATCP